MDNYGLLSCARVRTRESTVNFKVTAAVREVVLGRGGTADALWRSPHLPKRDPLRALIKHS